MVSIAITGSQGMLGSDLVQVLREKNQVISCTRQELDFTDQQATLQYFKKIQPQVIIHAGAYTNVDACEQKKEYAYLVNAQGPKNIALAALETGAFLIHISTDYVFDGTKNTPYLEDDSCSPLSIYGISKWLGEKNIQETFQNYLIIRTSWLYGRQGINFITKILDKTKTINTLKIVSDQRGSPTYTKDLSYAIYKLLNKIISGSQPKGIINLVNSGNCSWYEFSLEIIKLAGVKNIEINPVSSAEFASRVRRPAYSVLDCSKYNKIIGSPLRHWKEALADYIKEG